MAEDQELEETLSRIVEGLGLHLVEMSLGRHRGDVKVNLVLYKSGGIGLDDLTEAQKTIRPRLELEFDREGLSVEISSPGTTRILKRPDEYRIFAGREIKLLIDDDWSRGTIESADDKKIHLRTDDGIREIAIPDVRKAKLV
jgi:ribosome maturation factor RimP